MGGVMRILLVDDHRLLLEGLANLLDSHGIEVVGMAHDGQEAFEQACVLQPGVILMDIRMPNCDGLTATRLIKAKVPDVKIIILTSSTEDSSLFEAVKSGANGYLLKSMDAEELVEALAQVEQGIPPFSPGLAGKLLEEFARLGGIAAAGAGDQPERQAPRFKLTPRQTEVLHLVAQGLSYKEVGASLSLSPRTIKYHMAEIMEQLHLENRAQVIAFAGKMGVDCDP
jgi:DNA-binding NarL/FixJ family response regulator